MEAYSTHILIAMRIAGTWRYMLASPGCRGICRALCSLIFGDRKKTTAQAVDRWTQVLVLDYCSQGNTRVNNGMNIVGIIIKKFLATLELHLRTSRVNYVQPSI
jgi:hypothetical protein